MCLKSIPVKKLESQWDVQFTEEAAGCVLILVWEN